LRQWRQTRVRVLPVLTPARTVHPLQNSDTRTTYLRGHFDAAAAAFDLTGTQESHAIGGLSRANALARLEPGTTVAAGDAVSVAVLNS
jgi:molybdopterin biosynthesis enzyme